MSELLQDCHSGIGQFFFVCYVYLLINIVITLICDPFGSLLVFSFVSLPFWWLLHAILHRHYLALSQHYGDCPALYPAYPFAGCGVWRTSWEALSSLLVPLTPLPVSHLRPALSYYLLRGNLSLWTGRMHSDVLRPIWMTSPRLPR